MGDAAAGRGINVEACGVDDDVAIQPAFFGNPKEVVHASTGRGSIIHSCTVAYHRTVDPANPASLVPSIAADAMR